jgi:hypothetical protein
MPPQEIALAANHAVAPLRKKRNFAGTPGCAAQRPEATR